MSYLEAQTDIMYIKEILTSLDYKFTYSVRILKLRSPL